MVDVIRDSVGIISNASNVQHGENSPYLITDFYKMFPQFENKIDDEFVLMYIGLANASLSEKMYGTVWTLSMSYFVAHFCALHLQSVLTPESNEAKVISVAQSKGLISSKSAGDVSVSYDFSPIVGSLNGWVSWKLTTYGIQFASIARMIGKGCIMVW